MSDLLSVDQLADILDLHPRTIRRYIRDGQLKATKVGGEWRIRKEDAEMLIGGRIEELNSEATQDIQAYLDGKDSECEGPLQVCTVLDCYVNTPQAVLISQVIMQHMNQADSPYGKAKFQYLYDSKEKKGRYILWGHPYLIGAILTDVAQIAE